MGFRLFHSRSIRTLFGLALGGLFLYLAVRDVDFSQVLVVFKNIAFEWLAVLVLLFLLTFWFRSLRWRWMFPQEKAPTRREAFDAFMIGALGNNLMPGRLGDLLRGAVLGRHLSEIGTSGAIASIVLEKVFDGIVVLLMLLIVLLVVPLPEWMISAGLLGALGFGGALIVLIILSFAGSSDRFLSKTSTVKTFSFIADLVKRLSSGLHGLRSHRRFAELLGFSILIWSIEVIVIIVTFNMFDLSLPFEASIVTIVLLAVGTMLPAAPGFVGTYQYFVLTALSLYDVSQETSIALAITLNLLVIVVTTVTGVIAVFLEGGMGDVLKEQLRMGRSVS